MRTIRLLERIERSATRPTDKRYLSTLIGQTAHAYDVTWLSLVCRILGAALSSYAKGEFLSPAVLDSPRLSTAVLVSGTDWTATC